jgi:putative NADH-flavin reductase
MSSYGMSTKRWRSDMRAFVAGATGAIGIRRVPELVACEHQVTAWSRSLDKVERPRTVEAER